LRQLSGCIAILFVVMTVLVELQTQIAASHGVETHELTYEQYEQTAEHVYAHAKQKIDGAMGAGKGREVECPATQCTDGCDPAKLQAALAFISKSRPATPVPAVATSSVEAFQKCMATQTHCTKSDVSKATPGAETDSCTAYAECKNTRGADCAEAYSSIMNRVMSCGGSHLVKTGRVLDFSAGTGGRAIPLLAGIKGSRSYTAAEADENYYGPFAHNMEGQDFALLKTSKCGESFHFPHLVEAVDPELLIVDLDDLPEAAATKADPSQLWSPPANAPPPGVRQVVLRVHAGESSKLGELMDALVEQGSWTRIHSSEAYFSWAGRPNGESGVLVYVKGAHSALSGCPSAGGDPQAPLRKWGGNLVAWPCPEDKATPPAASGSWLGRLFGGRR